MNLITKYFFASLLLLSTISCSDDDNSAEEGGSNQNSGVTVSESDLSGSWNLVGLSTENGQSITEAQGQSIELNFTNSGSNFDYVATFETNPNVVTGSGTYDVTTTTSFAGQEVEQTISFDSDNFDNELLTGNWELSEDGTSIITRSDDGRILSESDIIEFSENRLVYTVDLSKAEVDEESVISGTSITITGNTVLTFTR